MGYEDGDDFGGNKLIIVWNKIYVIKLFVVWINGLRF